MEDASAMQIEFTENSVCDDAHGILFSYDKQGLRPVEEEASGMSSLAQGWRDQPRGPDIAYSNNDMTVTRTNSSGWGTCLWANELESGRYIFNLKIDNDGGSDYLYIGLIEYSDSPGLSDVINRASDVTWKRVGNFHDRGGESSIENGRYGTGDELSIDIDMDSQTMVLSKNGSEVKTHNFSMAKAYFGACFGGDNQNVTILSVNTPGGTSTGLSNKKLLAMSDKVFYHFPINVGYLTRNKLRWEKTKGSSVVYSEDLRTLTRSEGDEGIRAFKT